MGFGRQQPHGSVISAWGKPTIGYGNVLEVTKAKNELESIEPMRKLNYRSLVTECYTRLLHMGIHRDLIMEEARLEGYNCCSRHLLHTYPRPISNGLWP